VRAQADIRLSDVTLTTDAREQATALTAARNSDGGWGYARRRTSRLEPTCLAMLALAVTGHTFDLSVLMRWPREGGLLIDLNSRGVNAADNGIALLVAQHWPEADNFTREIARAVAEVKGKALPPAPDTSRQDNGIQGWPWVATTFSWVEPTAWCVLALKKWLRGHSDPAAAGRVAEGERLLLDRVCRSGGWNYGNSNMLGKELFPYVPTTAIALLALQDRRDHEAVKRSLDYLSTHCLDERSGLSLSLSRIALAVFGAPNREADLESALAQTWHSTRFMGNLAATALALYASASTPDHYAAFRL
jgi:hypothetical protein